MNTWKSAIGAAIILAIAAVLSGCMQCSDGKMHTICTALQIERSINAAKAGGAVAAYTPDGNVRFLRGAEARQYRTVHNKAIEGNGPSPVVEPYAGASAEELRQEYYSPGLRALAWVGDLLTWAGISGVAVRAGDALVSATDSGSEVDSDSSRRTVQIRVDNGSTARINTQVGQYNEGGQGNGDAEAAAAGE